MNRIVVNPRRNWQEIVEGKGLTFHSRDGVPYWNESACYEFDSDEIDVLEKAANDVHELCLTAAQHVVDEDLFERLAIKPEAAELIRGSWNADQLHLYGRFDFAYDGKNPPRLLEYNADTPTSLLEAAVIQWYWMKDVFPKADQFNSLHEQLIERWKNIKLNPNEVVHFSAIAESEEDIMTVEYLRDTANQAGFKTDYLHVQDIGFDNRSGKFADLKERPIETLFKLYPWEWLIHEEFGKHISNSGTRFIEPPWKMMWSNKGILPILWELNPGHPNLLPAYFTPEKAGRDFVKKPLLSREGANVTVVNGGQKRAETAGEYGEEGYVYQQFAHIPMFNGRVPVLGLWMIGDECKGMGIRESDGLVTNNTSQFVPHFFNYK